MAFTPTEEALVRQLLAQQPAILSLAGNEATITSKLGATKVTLSDLAAASSLADADLLLTRQGTTDKSVTNLVVSTYMQGKLDPRYVKKAGDTLTGALVLAGGDTGTTAAQFDNTTKLASTAFVKAAGFHYPTPGAIGFASNTTLTISQLNAWGIFNAASVTLTLPAIATAPAGSTFTILGGAFGGTLKANAAEIIFSSLNVGANTLLIGAGEVLSLVSNGSTNWCVVSDGYGSPSFLASKLSTGYQKLPGGLTLQWGGVTSSGTSAGNASATFPLTFSAGCLWGIATSRNANGTATVTGSNTTTLTITSYIGTTITSGVPIDWVAIGF